MSETEVGAKAPEMRSGTRVRLRAPFPLLALASDTGTIVRKDRWADYYIVHLDLPARYHRSKDQVEILAETREDADNLEVIL